MRLSISTVITVLVPSIALAQQRSVPIVDLPEPTARTAERLGAVLGVREGADGKVLVNDALRRQMFLYDTTLNSRVMVMDSTSGTSTSYGPAPTPLIRFIGDSSLIADWRSLTAVVLDGHGRAVRTIALPRPQDIIALISASSGFDAKGRLLFQVGRQERQPVTVGVARSMEVSDSLAILRADLDTRRVDTVAKIARPAMKVTTQKSSGGTSTTIFALDPLQAVDDWAILSNGAIAIVRGGDYHIDWIDSDGSMRSSAKIPFAWTRLTDEDKTRESDSLRAAQDSLLAKGYPYAEMMLQGPVPCERPDGARGTPPDGVGGRGGGRVGGAPNGPPPPAGNGCWTRLRHTPPAVGAPTWNDPPMPPLADLSRYNPIPDYAPPIRVNATVADLDGNLWILPRASTLSRRGELVYDVVNASGELFERVRVPLGRAIAGFAKGGVVYLTAGDLKSGFYLERSRLP